VVKRGNWRRSILRVKIYIEGGAKNNSHLNRELRKAFSSLFEKLGVKDKISKIIASGSRNEAFDDFKTAFKKAKKDEGIMLLVDSEDAITTSTKWEHVKKPHWR
jgi:hypothetical protein